MAGSVSNAKQALPLPGTTNVPAGSISGTTDAGLDGTEAPYSFLLDANNPGAKVPIATVAQDGTDASDAGALQATAGAGIRGWLSTLVSLQRAQSATVTSVPASTVSAPLLAANAHRKGVSVFNDANGFAYIAFAATASATTYTVKVAPGAFWACDPPVYVGVVSCVWDAGASGNAHVTETS